MAFDTKVKRQETLRADQRVSIIDTMQQDVLSGYSDLNKFETLKTHLSYFKNTLILDEDYIAAAKFYNECGSSCTP
ncbi:MAG: hypothetical protein QX197_01250 [Methylococcaceae bacterium]